MKYDIGMRVEKTTGDYIFNGVVVAVFQKRNTSATRYVVENDDGMCFIFNESQLEPVIDK